MASTRRKKQILNALMSWAYLNANNRDAAGICFTNLSESEADYLRDVRKRMFAGFGHVEIEWAPPTPGGEPIIEEV